MTIQWSFFYNSFVKLHGTKFGIHISTLCYIQMCDITRCVIQGLHWNLNIIVFDHQIFAADVFKFCPAPKTIDLIIHANSVLADDSHDMPLNFFLRNLERYHNICHAERRSTVSNMSDCRYVSDCRSRGREFDPGPVSYFHGD